MLSLSHKCSVCNHSCILDCKYIGTMISVKQTCHHCNHQQQWNSQPMVHNIPAGNILLSASIYFNGGSFKKFHQVLSSLQMQTISLRSHYSHMHSYLQPTIFSAWKDQQAEMFNHLHSLGGSLTLGGDMRADSPGHCAKYGCYTMMELETNRVIDIQLVQVKRIVSITIYNSSHKIMRKCL